MKPIGSLPQTIFTLRHEPLRGVAQPRVGRLVRAPGHRSRPEHHDTAGDITMEDPVLTPDSIVLETKELCAGFDGRDVVNGISLAVPAGKITAIMGPSGCGKTTFMRCINRMHELAPNAQVSGQVLLDGEDVYGISPIQLRRRIGMVFQRPNPFPTMSIYDNVIAGYTLNGVRMARPDRDRIVEETLRRVTLWDEVKDSLHRRGHVPLGRAAAAPVHRPGPGHEARDPAAGRADLGARPPGHRGHRGAHHLAQGRGHDRAGDAQHPAGCPHLRLHRVHPPRRAGRVRTDEEAVHRPEGHAHGGVPGRASSDRRGNAHTADAEPEGQAGRLRAAGGGNDPPLQDRPAGGPARPARRGDRGGRAARERLRGGDRGGVHLASLPSTSPWRGSFAPCS